MNNNNDILKFAVEIRVETLKCLDRRGFGHIGGSLSIVDTLAALYGGIMNIDPKNPKKEDRDMLIVSKGHAGPAVFAALALKGYFPIEWLLTMSDGGTRLPSHCDRLKTPGIDASTGSLGQGVSVAVGMAHSAKLQAMPNKFYCILGDGEIQEGQVWEAALYANQYKLNNLICFVDWNKKQIDGTIDEVMTLLDIEKKFSSFGWYALTVDGTSPCAVRDAILKAQSEQGEKPAMIVLDGIKGSGVKVIEELPFNHLIYFNKEIMDTAIKGLEDRLAEIEEDMAND